MSGHLTVSGEPYPCVVDGVAMLGLCSALSDDLIEVATIVRCHPIPGHPEASGLLSNACEALQRIIRLMAEAAQNR